LKNLFSIVDQLLDRRLARPRKGQCRIDSLHTRKDFRVAGASSVRTRVVSHSLQVKGVFVVAARELGAHDGGEHFGVRAYQRELLFVRWPPWPGFILHGAGFYGGSGAASGASNQAGNRNQTGNGQTF
jgi:hypothetical protein